MTRGAADHMTRRRVLAGVAGMVGGAGIGALLAACVPGSGGTGPASGQGSSVLPVPRTVEYWSRYGSGVALDAQNEQLKRYQERNPGVTVNAAAVTDNIHEKTVAAVAAGTPPDMSNYDRFVIASYAVRGVFVALNDLAKRDKITGQEYYPSAWNEAGFKGKLYALPYQTGVRALYYNKTHLQQDGRGPSELPRSITELDQWALRLTRQDGDRYTRVGFIPWTGNSHFYTWGWLFGGEFYDEKTIKCTANHPKCIEAMDWVGSYARRYGNDRLNAFTTAANQVQGGLFAGSQVTFLHSTQADVPNIERQNPQLEFGVMPLPPAPGQTKTSTWSGGFGYVVPTGAKQIEAAWHLMKFLSSDEGELVWTSIQGSLPVRHNVARSQYWQDQAKDPRMKVFLDLLPSARWRPVMPAAQNLATELTNAQNQVRAGQKLAKDALDEVTQKINLELAQFG